MRIKARALGLAAEDYFNDKVLEDTDLLYTGVRELPADFWDKHGKDMESWQQDGRTFYRVHGPLCPACWSTSSSIRRPSGPSTRWCKELSGKTAILQTLIDYSHTSATTSGASPRATASRTSRSTC